MNKQMDLGRKNNSSTKLGSMTTGTFTQKAHDEIIKGNCEKFVILIKYLLKYGNLDMCGV